MKESYELWGALKEAFHAVLLAHARTDHPELYHCTCDAAKLYRSLIAEYGDECSICRRTHGLEYVHECE